MRKVSVIVPVYNNEERISRCIKSILNQTYEELELIIINDGSTDHSEEIIKGFKDPRLFYHFQQNSGPSIARNKGLDIANGDYILFVDSDDYIDSNMLELLISATQKNNADIVCCNIIQKKKEYIFKEIKEPYQQLQSWQDFFREFVIGNGTCSLCNKIIKRNLFEKIRLYEDIHLGEDSSALLRLLPYTNTIMHINKGLYIYDLTHEGISSKRKKNVCEYLLATNRVINYYEKEHIDLPLKGVFLKLKICYYTLLFCPLGKAKKIGYWDYFYLADSFSKDFHEIVSDSCFHHLGLKYKLFTLCYYLYYIFFYRHYFNKVLAHKNK